MEVQESVEEYEVVKKVQKFVEVPHITKVQKFVDVPVTQEVEQVIEIPKIVEVEEVVDVPVVKRVQKFVEVLLRNYYVFDSASTWPGFCNSGSTSSDFYSCRVS